MRILLSREHDEEFHEAQHFAQCPGRSNGLPGASGVVVQPASESAAASPPATTSGAASETGRIAWCGRKFAGRKTACGEAFNPDVSHAVSRKLGMLKSDVAEAELAVVGTASV